MKYIYLTILTFVSSLFISTDAKANLNIIPCNSCNFNQMQDAASRSGKNGVVNVVDFNFYQNNTFQVFNEPGVSTAIALEPNREVSEALSDLEEFKQQVLENISGDIPVTDLSPYMVNIPKNVTYIAKYTHVKNNVGMAITKYFDKKFNIKNIRNITGVLGSAAMNSVIPTKYAVDVTFSGDQRYTYVFSHIELKQDGTFTIEFTPKIGSGEMGNISVIGTTNEEFTLTGRYSDIAAAVTVMGYTINYGGRTGSGSIGCSTVTSSCSKVFD